MHYNGCMRRTVVSIAVSFFCLLTAVSCFGTDFVELKVSASQSGSSSPRAIFNARKYDISSDMLKDEVKGEPVATVTPTAFILDIDRIRLFNPSDSEDLTNGSYESMDLIPQVTYEAVKLGNIIPTRYNMLSSKGVKSLSLPLSILKKEWHGLSLMIRPGGNETTNGMWAGSVIGIRKDSLPSGIDADMIENRLTGLPFGLELPDDSVWFSFQNVLPFKTGGMLSYITFYDGADDVYLINPDGENGSWHYGGESSRGNQTGTVFPMDTINLSELKNPEITVSVDTNDLIEIYETSSGTYYVSLAKSDPFPFRVIVDEYDPDVFLYSEQAVTDIKDASPFDCIDYKMNSKRGICHILTYTQANYSGLSHVEIFRSEKADFDENAVLIYSGEDLSIVDYDCPKDREVYYFIRSVNTEGEKSDMKAFTRIDSSGI